MPEFVLGKFFLEMPFDVQTLLDTQKRAMLFPNLVSFAVQVLHGLEHLHALNIAHRVEFLGPIPQRSDLLAQTLQSDIGLALMPLASSDSNCETMTGASNKVFDYMACGLALVVSDRTDWRGMFAEAGYGRACDPGDPVSIAAALRELLANPAVMRQAGERGRQQILAQWNYETMFLPVFGLMSRKPGRLRK